MYKKSSDPGNSPTASRRSIRFSTASPTGESDRRRDARFPRVPGLPTDHRRGACQTESEALRAQRASALHQEEPRRPTRRDGSSWCNPSMPSRASAACPVPALKRNQDTSRERPRTYNSRQKQGRPRRPARAWLGPSASTPALLVDERAARVRAAPSLVPRRPAL
jgi:hypothetical protein